MTSTLTNLVSAIKIYAPEAAHFLESRTEFKTYAKGEMLVRKGEVNDTQYYIQKGLARTFHVEAEEEITSWFFWEDSFMNIPSSYYFQKPAMENIQILEDSEILCLKRADLEQFYQTNPALYLLNQKITENYFGYFDEHFRMMRKHPEKRYEIFLENYKAIINRVSQKHIATFLGIAPETLSRIRGKKK